MKGGVQARGEGLGPAQSAEVEAIVNQRVGSASADLKQMIANELASAGPHPNPNRNPNELASAGLSNSLTEFGELDCGV